MSRLLDPAKIGNGLTVAKMLGVHRSAVSNWRVRYADCPKPVFERDGTVLFDLDEFAEWARTNGHGRTA